MKEDIGPLLKKWKYKSDDLNVRIVEGFDGKQKLQMRLDLGILQMELDGRPDGRRPGNCDSYLTLYEKKSKALPETFALKSSECVKLQQEALQYYHRYLALMKMEDYPRVARDTERNLMVFDLIENYAKSKDIIWSFLQYRPYVLMMNTRALASISLKEENFDEALEIIHKGIQEIEFFYKIYPDKGEEIKFELEFLHHWEVEIKENKPLSPKERLNIELSKAVEREDYEHAASLRDEINYILRSEAKKKN